MMGSTRSFLVVIRSIQDLQDDEGRGEEEVEGGDEEGEEGGEGDKAGGIDPSSTNMSQSKGVTPKARF